MKTLPDAVLVLDLAQRVRHPSITDRDVGRAPAETLRILQALRTGELCPVGWRPAEPTLTQTLAFAS